MYLSLFLLNLFDIYIHIQFAVCQFIQDTPILMYLVCTISDYKLKLHNFFYRIRVEPNETTWICSSYMNRISINIDKCESIYGYNEIYGKEDQFEYVKKLGHRDMIYHSLCIPLFIIKFEGNYLYRLLLDDDDKNTEYHKFDKSLGIFVVVDTESEMYSEVSDMDTEPETETETESEYETDTDTESEVVLVFDIDLENNDIKLDDIKFIPSSVRFLSIEYTNSLSKTPIYLQLPEHIYIVGSQILSAVFIVRLLEYTIGESYTFDMDYQLNIMDKNIHVFSLLSHQYIELYENEYKIMDLK